MNKAGTRQKSISKIIIILIFILMPNSIWATEQSQSKQEINSIIQKQINTLDLSEPERVIDELKSGTSNRYLEEFDIKQTMLDLITGKGNITPVNVINGIMKLMFGEVSSYFTLMGKLIILSVFCTVLSTLSVSFESKSTSQVAFYVCYIVLIIALTESFTISMNIAQATIDKMTMTMHASVPVMMTLLISTGNVTSGSVFQPIVISSIQVAVALIKNTVLPMVFFVAILQIVNNISEEFKIQKLVDLFYLSVKWLLRGTVVLFVGIMGIYGLTTPYVDGTINKTAKSMVETFVPVVGDALTGTIDLIMNCGVLVKNSYTIGVIIILLLVCAVPLIKVFLCMIVYQVTSAIIEPISDKRIAECMSGMGKATGYLLGTLSTVMILFILNMLILVGVGNITAVMR